MEILNYIYQRIFDNSTKKITAKNVRESFAKVDEKIDKISIGIQGALKITDPKPAADKKGLYVLPDIGEYTTLVPIVPDGATSPQNTPITTLAGFQNSVYWDGTNFTQIKISLPQASSNLRKWENILASDFPLTDSAQVVKDESIWILKDESATINDVPGVSEKWVKIGGDDFSADVDKLNLVLKSFINGYNFVKKILPQTKLGYIKNDGTIFSGSENRYADVDVTGYDKIKYIGAPAVSLDTTIYSTILVKKSDNSYVVLLPSHYYDYPQSSISQIFNLPNDAVLARIGWSNYMEFANSTCKIELSMGDEATEDSVLKLINSKETIKPVGSETHVFIEKPVNFVPIVNLIGSLPTDESPDRAKTDMILEMYNDSILIFKCKVEVKIQGQSSVAAYKKNFSVKFINDVGSTLRLKIGDWNLDSSFHFKGYGTSDGLLISRDISSANLLNQILKSRPFPKSLVSDFPRFNSTNDSSSSNFGEDSNMTLRGFPMQLNLNGEYRGLYIWRQRRENGNYRMNKDVKSNIFLANSNATEINMAADFDPQNWELKSPKVSGYVENGVITDAVVMGHINNLFNWCKGVANNSIDFETTAPSIINIENWVDTIIFNQVVMNWDYYVNNLNLFFWGTKWSLGVTDLDWTCGLGTEGVMVAGFGGVNSLNWRGTFFPNKIYPALLSRIKTRYTELRNLGIIELNNLYKIYSDIPAKIGENRYKKEIEYWTTFTGSNSGFYNTEKIMQLFIDRIVFLDSIWKL